MNNYRSLSRIMADWNVRMARNHSKFIIKKEIINWNVTELIHIHVAFQAKNGIRVMHRYSTYAVNNWIDRSASSNVYVYICKRTRNNSNEEKECATIDCGRLKIIDDHKMWEAFWSFLDIWFIAFSIAVMMQFYSCNKFTNSSQLENMIY